MTRRRPEARPDDVQPFLATLKALDAGGEPSLGDFFSPRQPTVIARAPGRLDVMGGIADYSGALVLQLPLVQATLAAAQRNAEAAVRVVSLPSNGPGGPRQFGISCAGLERLVDEGYGVAGEFFRRDPGSGWAGYVVGTLLVLARERGIRLDTGLRVLIDSRVPEGKGVSSSAALEVATMQAVAGLLGVEIEGAELAALCQVCENRVVGAPCGIMDQMTSALGQGDRLLALLCQPAEVRGFVDIPADIRVWGIDSDVRHAVSGSDYTAVRVGAFMGYRIIADLAGLEVTETTPEGVLRIEDPRWRGYLANLDPAEFGREFSARIPRRLGGSEFLERYGGLTDPVTRVDPDREYAVRQPTAHPIEENDRVRRFAELLPRSRDEETVVEMGALMYASHESYSACGLGSRATDRIVELVREAGRRSGLYGAKITGGGSGGTVAVLGRADAGPVVDDIASRYAIETGRRTFVFSGSSPGACEFGVIRAESFDEL